jgi:hypothetical protein
VHGLVWHPFEVDGVEYAWTSRPGRERVDREPWRDIEELIVRGAPMAGGVGTSYAAGTVVTEAHAVALVRKLLRDGSNRF